jgi:simple sugar transport system ATP-binding protein
MTELMVGRKIIMSYEQFKETTDKEVLSFKVEDVNLVKKGVPVLKHVSFGVRAGEILGIAGVQGNGQNELIEGLVGMGRFNSGKWYIEGEELTSMTIEQRRAAGMAYIPEDRMKDGIAQGASVAENMISTYYKRPDINGKIFMNNKNINALAQRLITLFSVKTKNPKTKIESLSGGNIQKVVVARETNTSPKILIAEQPTRGIDIGSEEFIHHELIKMRNKDVAILLVSADLNEVMEVSDRLIVMYEGEIVAHFDSIKGVTDKELGLYMLGAKRQDEESIRRALAC